MIRSLLFAVALLVPVTANAQTDAFCTAVYDADGTRVGRADNGGTASGLSGVENHLFFVHQGRIARITARLNQLVGNASIFFTGASCTGDM